MSKLTYFQFGKEANLPIFVAVDLAVFDTGLNDLMSQMRFSKLSEKEEAEVQKIVKNTRDSRLLKITEASFVVSKQIQKTTESDRYGSESIEPKEGFRIYRYKDHGIMIYSFSAKEWELGVYRDFAVRNHQAIARTMLNRFLSLSLAPLGIVGVWGVSVEDSMVAQRPKESKGEAVFIDLYNHRVFSMDGVKSLTPRFKVLRLDPTIKARNIKMTTEEFFSFLCSHCSYLDYSGLSVPVRQMLQAFSKLSTGVIHPMESFRPRTDLSL